MASLLGMGTNHEKAVRGTKPKCLLTNQLICLVHGHANSIERDYRKTAEWQGAAPTLLSGSHGFSWATKNRVI